MAKAKTFADKMAKDQKDFTTHCPKCGESISTIQLVTSELSDKTGAWKFKQNFVGICKCNANDVTKPIDRGELIRPKPNQPAVKKSAAEDQPQTAKAAEPDTVEKGGKNKEEQASAPESGKEEPEAKGQKDEAKASESGDKKSG